MRSIFSEVRKNKKDGDSTWARCFTDLTIQSSAKYARYFTNNLYRNLNEFFYVMACVKICTFKVADGKIPSCKI